MTTRRRVFVSLYSVKAPGIWDHNDILKLIFGENNHEVKQEIIHYSNRKIIFGRLNLNENSKHFPRRSDVKIMRQDVIATSICVNEIIDDAKLSKDVLSEMPLFISNGICLEKLPNQSDLISKAVKIVVESNSDYEKFERIYQFIPPLLALQTLTNASEHFASQYSGITGDNTTFGNTSQSAFYALKEAFSKIELGENDIVLVGGSNCGGIYSHLTFKNFTGNDTIWHESPCAAFLLLESKESLEKYKRKPQIEIKLLKSSHVIPDIYNTSSHAPYKSLNLRNKDEFGIFSGGFSESDYAIEKKAANSAWNESFSWYPILGNMGAASIYMNIIAAIQYSKSKKHKFIVCVDCDPYARESYIELSGVRV